MCHSICSLGQQGPNGATVDWTITLKAGGSQVGTASWSTDACTQGITNSCSFDHEELDVDLGQDQSFTVSKNEMMEISISAEMSAVMAARSQAAQVVKQRLHGTRLMANQTGFLKSR